MRYLSLEAIIGQSYIYISVFGAFEQFKQSGPKFTKPEAKNKTKKNKCGDSHLLSDEVSIKCKKPSDGSVVLVLGYLLH